MKQERIERRRNSGSGFRKWAKESKNFLEGSLAPDSASNWSWGCQDQMDTAFGALGLKDNFFTSYAWEKAKPRADLSVGSGKKITWKTRLFVCVCTTDRLITTMKLLSSLWCDNQPKKVDNSAKIVPKRLTKFPFVKLFHKKKNEEQICGEGESVAQLYYYYIPLLQFFATTLQGLTGQAPTMLGEKISSLP